MTDQEKKIVKAYLVRTQTEINEIQRLADHFAGVGMNGVSEKLRSVETSLKYNLFNFLSRELGVND